MYRLFRCKKGFTLVEILVSMAIIAILAMAFFPLLSTSFVNIFAYGERDRAMTAASDIMEHLYASQPFDDEDEEDIEDEIEDELAANYDDYDFHANGEEKTIKNVEGYKVTIEVRYQDGEREVTLTSFVRGDH